MAGGQGDVEALGSGDEGAAALGVDDGSAVGSGVALADGAAEGEAEVVGDGVAVAVAVVPVVPAVRPLSVRILTTSACTAMTCV